MDLILSSLEIFLRWDVWAAILVGSIGGVIIGAIPGVGPAVAIAILLPATYSMDPLIGYYYVTGYLWFSNVWWCDSGNFN